MKFKDSETLPPTQYRKVDAVYTLWEITLQSKTKIFRGNLKTTLDMYRIYKLDGKAVFLEV